MAWRAVAWGVSCAAALTMAGGVLASPVVADGDPASDALIVQSIFYPYSTSVPAISRRSLSGAVRAAAQSGAAVKVAIIAHPSDLGSITALYGQPEQYARFLHTEISYGPAVRLLVVMPSGDGTAGCPRGVAGSLHGGAPAGAAAGAALADAATEAVRRLTATARRTGGLSDTGTSAGGGQTVLLLLILAAVLVSGAIVVLRVFFSPSAGASSRGGKT